MAKANNSRVKKSAEVKCSRRLSFSAKPRKNHIAARLDRIAPLPAASAAMRSALRPIGLLGASGLQMGSRVSSVMRRAYACQRLLSHETIRNIQEETEI